MIAWLRRLFPEHTCRDPFCNARTDKHTLNCKQHGGGSLLEQRRRWWNRVNRQAPR